jgi:4'-phosphopantetheinyl transferase
MPFLKKIEHPEYTLGLWHITESSGTLFDEVRLSDEDLRIYNCFSNERRKREFLATRHLLHLLTGETCHLDYHPNGRPALNDPGKWVSISHSVSMAAVVIASKPAGIDVEETSRNIGKVAGRFLSAEELEWTGSMDQPEFIRLICWCVKECIYKMADSTEVDFARQIVVYPFILEDKHIEAAFLNGDHVVPVSLQFSVEKNNVVIWGVE